MTTSTASAYRARGRAGTLGPTCLVGEYSTHHGPGLVGGHGGREEVSLAQLTTHPTEPVVLDAGLDALGDHRHVQTLAERDDRLEEQIVARVGLERAHEGLIDLDDAR